MVSKDLVQYNETFIDNITQRAHENFEKEALTLFQYQYNENAIYREFVQHLHIKPKEIKQLEQIPFLPVELFKRHTIKSGNWEPETWFESSGTTGQERSQHFIKSVSHYHALAKALFEAEYGPLTDYHIFGLLPSYLERSHASLVDMISFFMQESRSEAGGFFLHDHEQLFQQITLLLEKEERKVLLFGVTFALLDMAEAFPGELSSLIVMETGGMKGRRKEMLREEVHDYLKNQWKIPSVHSEYGMTELLSQSYSQGSGVFKESATMRLLIRDVNDPLTILPAGKSGGINVIDLGNVHSCAFLATKDIGIREENGQFQVLGRFDNSDIRGCNLLVD